MINSRLTILSLITACLMFFLTQTAMAGADWREKQSQMFAQIPVKSGDVIDKSNWEKVKDLLPEPFLEHGLKTGDWILNIGEFEYDHDYDAEYIELSSKNAGKYALGPKKEIIDVKTGTYPMFVRGMPFPNVDVANDPDGAIKFMHNKELNIYTQVNYAGLTYPPRGNLQWVGRGGYERGVGFLTERHYWWNRYGGEIPNPRKYKFTVIPSVTWPFDLWGTVTLYVRHLDGRDDSVYAYVPAIRRVKRLSGANRSDPQMGSDQCMDDSNGFGGHIESMKWSYIGEKIMLKPMWKQDAKEPRKVYKNEVGAWEFDTQDSSIQGYSVDGWSGAPWAYTELVWIPREMYILKATPLDPYYAYGMLELYLDKLTTQCAFNMKYTKAGDFWKYLVFCPAPAVWRDGRMFFSIDGPMSVVDVKTDHASNLDLDNNLMVWDTPRINPANHSPQSLRTWTK